MRVVLECIEEKTDKFRKIDIDADEVYLFKNTAGKYIFKLGRLYYVVTKAYYARSVDGKFVYVSEFDMDGTSTKKASQDDKQKLGSRKAYSTIATASPRLVGNFILSNGSNVT